MTVAVDAHVARRNADDLPLVAVEKLCRRKPRIDLDPERLRAGAEPACDCAKRADEIAMVAHQFRHRPVGQAQRSPLGQIIELIFCDRGFERAFRIRTPVGNQPVKSDRIDHGSREDMRADRRALFHDDDRDLGIQFLEPDRRGQARGARADDHDIVIHRFPRGQCRILGHNPFCHSRLGKQHFCVSSLSLGQPRFPRGAPFQGSI